MEPDKLPANARYLKRNHCPPLIAASTRSAHQAIKDASGEKLCAPVQFFSRHIPISRLRTFGGPGNGDYRGELLRAIEVIKNYAAKLELPSASVLLRLDSLYGDAAPLIDVLTAGCCRS
jgi:hypothetical protein